MVFEKMLALVAKETVQKEKFLWDKCKNQSSDSQNPSESRIGGWGSPTIIQVYGRQRQENQQAALKPACMELDPCSRNERDPHLSEV